MRARSCASGLALALLLAGIARADDVPADTPARYRWHCCFAR